MSAYQPGEIVNITISGARVSFTSDGGHLSLSFGDDPAAGTIWLPLNPAVRVARVVPAEGEPQPGEVWADQAGGTYFARLFSDSLRPEDWVELMPAAGGPSVKWLIVHNGPAGPIERVWRPDPPKPEPVDEGQADDGAEQRDDSAPAQPDSEWDDGLGDVSAEGRAAFSIMSPPPTARCTCDHFLSAHPNGGRCRRCDCTDFAYAGAELHPAGGHERGRP